MVRSRLLSFKDSGPNVKDNLLPKHRGGGTMNMISDDPGESRIYDVNLIKGNLVKMHADLCRLDYCMHDHNMCNIYS